MSKPSAPTAPEQDSLCGVAGKDGAGRCSIRKLRGPFRLWQSQKGADQQFRNEESIGSRWSRVVLAQPAGCSKWPDTLPAHPRHAKTRRFAGKVAASEGPRRYTPHFVWAVRPYTRPWRMEKPLQ